jgi:hypothetical protein
MRKENRNKLYIGFFIVFLMISSTIGFMYNSSSNTKKFNGYSFARTENGWITYIKEYGQYWSFNYLPTELNFGSNIGFLSDKVYIVLNDNDYSYDLIKKFALLGIVAERISLDEVNCGIEENTLVFNEKEYNKIYKEDNCIYLEGYIPKLIDRLFYHLLGVM